MQEMHRLYWQCFLQVEASSLHAPQFNSEKHIVRQHFRGAVWFWVFFRRKYWHCLSATSQRGAVSKHISLLQMKKQMQSLRPGSSKASTAAQGLCMLIRFKETLLCSLLFSKQLWVFSLLALGKNNLEINTPYRDFWARFTKLFRWQWTEKHALQDL